ncbi:MAG: universal stress protein [Geminicoccales bacterium]
MIPKIKTILVPFGDAERAGHALAAALAIGRRFEACIEGLHVRPSARDMLRHPNIIVPDSTRGVLLETAESGAKDIAARAPGVRGAVQPGERAGREVAGRRAVRPLARGGRTRSRPRGLPRAAREMVFGGVTRHLLSHAELPVLMAH